MKPAGHIVVTGGAGFIGSHLDLRLISEGFKVTILDNLSTGKEENIPRGANFIKIDLGEEKACKARLDFACDAIFHLAGQSSGEASFKDPFSDLKSHIHSTFWLLNWCREKAIPRFMYSSSMAVYGDPKYLPVDENHTLQPKTFYSAAKASAEVYVSLNQTMGVSTTIFRFFSVYGPGQNLDNKIQGMVSIFLSYILEKAPVVVKGSKDRFRDFVYIDDLVDAWMRAYNNPVSDGKVYNIASGKKTSVKDLIEGLKRSFGYQDYPVEYREGTPGDQFGVVGDIKRISDELLWEPKVDIQTGLNKMVNFEKERISVE